MLEKELCQVLWAFLKVVLSGSEERVVADRKVGIMHVYRYGNMEADIVLIQLAGNHDISEIKDEVAEIQHLTSMDFELIAVKVDDWNKELSPWKTPAVFGNEDFGDGAVQTLEEILLLCSDKSKTYYIPVLFILVVTCDHGIIRRSPEVTPLRIYLDIQIDISVFFVDPEECFLTFLHAHQLPVLVFERAFLIYIFKG
jgi:hypothetical protein